MEIDRQHLETLMIERSRMDLDESRNLHAGNKMPPAEIPSD